MKKFAIRLVGLAALTLLLTSPVFAGNRNDEDCDTPTVTVPEVNSTVVLFGMSTAGLMLARKRAQ